MGNQHLGIIAVLLFLILFTQLWGAGATKDVLGTVLVIMLGLGALKIVFDLLKALIEELIAIKRRGGAWIARILMFFGLAGLLIAAALSHLFEQGKEKINGFLLVSFLLFPMAALVACIETASSWVPEVPGAVLRFCSQLGQYIAAPVTLPMERWAAIKTKKASGSRVGPIRIGVSLAGAFLGGIYMTILAAFIIIICAGIVAALVFGVQYLIENF